MIQLILMLFLLIANIYINNLLINQISYRKYLWKLPKKIKNNN